MFCVHKQFFVYKCQHLKISFKNKCLITALCYCYEHVYIGSTCLAVVTTFNQCCQDLFLIGCAYIVCNTFRPAPLSVQCCAMHGQNINLPMCVSVCPSHFLLTRLQVRPLNRDFVGGLSRMVVKQFQDGGRPPLKIVISSHLGKKSSDFHEILYTAADCV